MNGSWLKNEMGIEMADTQQKRRLEQGGKEQASSVHIEISDGE